jgi:protein-disulfide isomerase
MHQRNIAIAVIGAVVIGAVGYLIGVEVAGRGPSATVVESAVKDYLAAHPDVVKSETVAAAELTDGQRAEVEGIIRNHLIANPEIVRDAIDELQRKQDQAEQAAQVAAITDNKDLLFTSDRQVVLGNPKGDVTLIEFFDYNCAYCRRAQADMKKLIADDSNLRVVLKEFPVLGDGSVDAARVSIAVKLIAPDKMEAFHDALISEPGQVNGDVALAVADQLGIDTKAVKAKMGSDEVNQTITEVYTLASQLQLTGTPTYVTADEVVVGAVGYDALKAKIAEARASCAGTTVC